MKYLFVVNPVSGGKDKTAFLQLLQDQSRTHGFDYSVFRTEGQDDAAHLRQKLSRYQPDRVAAVGGDGTINLVGRVLMQSEIPMGIIPLGSANGLATELELPEDHSQCLSVFLKSRHIARLDVLTINDYHCFHFADVGMNADLVRDFELDQRRGLFTYAKYFVKRLADPQEQAFEIQIDQRTVKCSGYLLALANGRHLGTGVVLNQCGEIADGLLEVIVIREIHVADLFRATMSMFNHEADYSEDVSCWSCSTAEIALPEPRYLQVDGEIVGEVDRIHAGILPQAIRVVLP